MLKATTTTHEQTAAMCPIQNLNQEEGSSEQNPNPQTFVRVGKHFTFLRVLKPNKEQQKNLNIIP